MTSCDPGDPAVPVAGRDGRDAPVEGTPGSPEELWGSEERFRKIFDNAPTGIAITDWEGRFEQCNPAYERLLGYSEDELRRMDFASLVHPEDRAANVAAVARLRTGEVPYVEIENRYLHRDGHPVWVHKFGSVLSDVRGSPSHLMALVTDITERRRLHEMVRASEEHFRAMFDSVAVGVAHVDLDGRFVRVNPAFEAITGRSAAELERLRFQDITHPEDLDVDLAQADRLVAGEIQRYSIPKRYLRADGSVVWVNLTGSLVRSPSGEPDYFVAVVEDITADLARQSAERQARERAELTAEVVSALEHAGSATAQAECLLGLLVPRFADYATVEAPDEDQPLVAAVHRDAELVPVLRELRRQHRLARHLPESVARSARGKPQLIARLTPEVRDRFDLAPEGRRLLDRLDPRSHMSVSLELGGGRFGALMVGRSDPAREPFDEDDLAFLERLSERAGVFLIGSWLRQEEHRISLRLQQALLPDRLGSAAGLDVAARYFAATELLEVGGDWYDALELGDGRSLFVVGDVVGHGLDAAAVMGRLRAGLAALATRDPDPGRLLCELDAFARSQGCDFATVCCAVVDPATGRVEYSSAGHPPMLVREAGGATRWLSDGGSVPLCSFAVGERPVATTTLEPGSLLLLYTDGLLEQRGEPLTHGLARLERAVRDVVDAEPGRLCDRLIEELTAGRDPEDDVVVLAVRLHPVLPLRRSICADAEQLAGLRVGARGWMRSAGVPEGRVDDVLLALGEACSNAIEHAYLDGADGTVDVELALGDGEVLATVRDHGAWRPPRRSGDRGRGTGIMRSVTDRFERRSGPDGTTVAMAIGLGSDR